MASALETRVVFLDHLSILLSGLDGISDERRMIDTTMTKLRSLVERTGYFTISCITSTENYIRCQP